MSTKIGTLSSLRSDQQGDRYYHPASRHPNYSIMDSSYKYTPVAVPIYGNDNINGLEVDEAVSALEERFFTAADTPSLDARPYLEVVAPATLPEVSI